MYITYFIYLIPKYLINYDMTKPLVKHVKDDIKLFIYHSRKVTDLD